MTLVVINHALAAFKIAFAVTVLLLFIINSCFIEIGTLTRSTQRYKCFDGMNKYPVGTVMRNF